MKKPQSFFRSLSSRIPARLSASSAAVAPLAGRSQFDELITAELIKLIPQTPSDHSECTTSSTWLIHALSASATTQKIALQSLANVALQDSDRKVLNEFLNDNVKLLDGCNEMAERIEMIRQYLDSLRIASHLLERNVSCLNRAEQALNSCEQMERKCRDKHLSLIKVLNQKLKQDTTQILTSTSELKEILSGSESVALMACGILGISLSLKSRHQQLLGVKSRQPMSAARSGWSGALHELQRRLKEEAEKKRKSGSSLTLTRLQMTVAAARKLRDQVRCGNRNDETKEAAEELTRRCGDLEEDIRDLEKGVKELYKNLISVRMCLLGILSQA
ncbi:hypothetical protein SLEP1_g34859 [Rubroshorea leprosula]|uniref:Uncharacterized protein n=1 Tax=Rubroshorea leprosula TaxID=152421 RepID=A0AAV5KLD2_9ROSI|nr:hypothetical protein SLEP1_g34859 [Rubroshorea leprosula]